MTNYVGFINSMLNLREQRLKEQIKEAEIAQANQERFASQMQSMGKGLAGMFGQMGENRMANQLMQEEFGIPGAPRAQAVNPALQGPADAFAAKQFTGGQDELQARIKMAQLRDQQMDTNIAGIRENRLGIADKRDYNESVRQYDTTEGRLGRKLTLEEQQEQRLTDAKIDQDRRQAEADARAKRAEIAALEKAALDKLDRTDRKAQQGYSNLEGYQAADLVFQKKMEAATTPEQYHELARNRTNWYLMSKKHIGDAIGEQPQIGPFYTAEQKAAIKQAQVDAAEAQTAALEKKAVVPGWTDMMREQLGVGSWGYDNPQEAARAAQAEYEGKQGILEGLRKSGVPAPAAEAEAPGVVAAAAPAKGAAPKKGEVGYTEVSPSTKKSRTWDGTKWIYNK